MCVYLFIYMYVCVCVCLCVCDKMLRTLNSFEYYFIILLYFEYYTCFSPMLFNRCPAALDGSLRQHIKRFDVCDS